jgi:hypothetical protein
MRKLDRLAILVKGGPFSMKLSRLFAWLFGKAKQPQQPAGPKPIEVQSLRFRPFPGNGARTFRSRSVRGNAA